MGEDQHLTAKTTYSSHRFWSNPSFPFPYFSPNDTSKTPQTWEQRAKGGRQTPKPTLTLLRLQLIPQIKIFFVFPNKREESLKFNLLWKCNFSGGIMGGMLFCIAKSKSLLEAAGAEGEELAELRVRSWQGVDHGNAASSHPH